MRTNILPWQCTNEPMMASHWQCNGELTANNSNGMNWTVKMTLTLVTPRKSILNQSRPQHWQVPEMVPTSSMSYPYLDSWVSTVNIGKHTHRQYWSDGSNRTNVFIVFFRFILPFCLNFFGIFCTVQCFLSAISQIPTLPPHTHISVFPLDVPVRGSVQDRRADADAWRRSVTSPGW